MRCPTRSSTARWTGSCASSESWDRDGERDAGSGERGMTSPQVVGRVVATELKPSTPHQFWFWTAPESPVGIGTIVRVDAEERTVFGVVTDGVSNSDWRTPLEAVAGAGGDPAASPRESDARASIRLYAAAVLRHVP